MLPDAPGRLSGTTCWPRRLLMKSAMVRPAVSVTPPGENGITRRIGLFGYADCAIAPGAAAAPRARAEAAARRRRRRDEVLVLVIRSPGLGEDIRCGPGGAHGRQPGVRACRPRSRARS